MGKPLAVFFVMKVAILLTLAKEGMAQLTALSAKSTTSLPLYYAWFVHEEDSEDFLAYSHKVLVDTLQTVPDFLSDVQNFTGHTYITDILEHYTRDNANEVLHCTAAYNGVYPNYTDGAVEYADKAVVKENTDKDSVLHAIGWILTKRTFGARMRLQPDQLLLWNQNDNEGNRNITKLIPKQNSQHHHLYKGIVNTALDYRNIVDQDPDILGNFQPTSGNGSRAHLTLGCAPNITAVNTGFDLVDIIRLEIANNINVKTYNLSDGRGWLRNYGDGQWVLYPTQQWLLQSTFRGYESSGSAFSNSLSLTSALTIITLTVAKLYTN